MQRHYSPKTPKITQKDWDCFLIEEIACETARLLRNRRIFQQSAVGIGIQPGIPGVKRKFRRRSAVGQHAQRRIDPAALRRIRDAAAHHD